MRSRKRDGAKQRRSEGAKVSAPVPPPSVPSLLRSFAPSSAPSSARVYHGGVLLEVVIAIALFVGAASFALAATRNVLAAVDRSVRLQEAVDLASTAMAELEAGLISLADLRDGELPAADAAGDEHDDRWSIDLDTQRTAFTGLTLVELTVREAGPPGPGGEAPAVFTLRQLLRLREREAEEYRQDELLRDLPPIEGPS